MEDDETDKVPKARLDEALAKLREANARVGELERTTRALEERATKAEETGRSANQLADRVSELEGELKRERTMRGEDNAIRGAGFGDAELVRFEYERATRELGDKRPGLAEWLDQVKADKGKAPAALAAMIDDQGGDDGDGDGGDGERKRRGTANRGGDAEDGKGSGGTGKDRNARLREINSRHRVGSSEWAEEAAGVLGDDHPAVKRARSA